jgi:hypothetical protein
VEILTTEKTRTHESDEIDGGHGPEPVGAIDRQGLVNPHHGVGGEDVVSQEECYCRFGIEVCESDGRYLAQYGSLGTIRSANAPYNLKTAISNEDVCFRSFESELVCR